MTPAGWGVWTLPALPWNPNPERPVKRITQTLAGGVQVDQEVLKTWNRPTAGKKPPDRFRRVKTLAVRTSTETKHPSLWRNTVGREYVERYNPHFGDWEIYRGTEPTAEPES